MFNLREKSGFSGGGAVGPAGYFVETVLTLAALFAAGGDIFSAGSCGDVRADAVRREGPRSARSGVEAEPLRRGCLRRNVR